jgi:hypothetical protein
MQTKTLEIKDAYMRMFTEAEEPKKFGPKPVEGLPGSVPETSDINAPAPDEADSASPEPAMEEPIADEPEAKVAPETVKEVQSKIIAILSTKLMGDVKDKIYELKFLMKNSKEKDHAFELINSINMDIKDINEKILNTFNK